MLSQVLKQILIAFPVLVSVTAIANEDPSVDEIKVRCDCDKGKWTIEKLSQDLVKKLFDSVQDQNFIKTAIKSDTSNKQN